MIFEDLYGKDMLIRSQIDVYRTVINEMLPVDERAVNYRKTQFLVLHTGGEHVLDILITPAHDNNFPIHISMGAESATLALGGWREVYPPKNTPDMTIADITRHLIEEIPLLLGGYCKIVEHRAGGKGYKWDRFDFIDGEWRFRSQSSVLLYNFFGDKTSEELFCKLT